MNSIKLIPYPISNPIWIKLFLKRVSRTVFEYFNLVPLVVIRIDVFFPGHHLHESIEELILRNCISSTSIFLSIKNSFIKSTFYQSNIESQTIIIFHYTKYITSSHRLPSIPILPLWNLQNLPNKGYLFFRQRPRGCL